MKITVRKTTNVQDPARPRDTDAGCGQGAFGSTGIGATTHDNVSSLTIGRLIGQLQEAASRYGDDTPVVIPTMADADYEQATIPIVMHARREPVPDDWDLFHIDPSGEAVVVIS